MKHLHLGVALLAAMLFLGIVTAIKMDRIHEPISQDLAQASQAALEDRWEEADRLWKRAVGRWRGNWPLTASVADHEPMEEIDGLFAELRIYAKQREAEHFAACCANLSTLTKAMGEAHAINWWNLL